MQVSILIFWDPKASIVQLLFSQQRYLKKFAIFSVAFGRYSVLSGDVFYPLTLIPLALITVFFCVSLFLLVTC